MHNATPYFIKYFNIYSIFLFLFKHMCIYIYMFVLCNYIELWSLSKNKLVCKYYLDKKK